ncbi:Pyrimidine monooxygenase RutA [Gluconacetobacter sp. SXCC-1]|uniref:LLM class flavin-dependent oxidoreductase n=1 Tax=Komagataeibacter rhaeticus TaxID=215221 RepID=UPI000207FBEC|nr:LLM class flavin-dependent oxidoreductase [Komagataeibacter rhaeticus]ATU71777.1 LLM class flavin-dependent oxidoreductase [Komagataeibacter xylinus]EGG75730.1 Pyrimidine monooxygenase RutA [Gluconacetobacter sp. SXCC-1]WPP23199.1 LLM class flavin-dependent oxidoreductase [Komagataeibacter rhaeticus]
MNPFVSPVFDLPSERGGKDFGIFMPIANGGWILSETAPKIDGSYEYNRKAALLAEEIGLDFIMSMAKFRGYGGVTQHWNTSLDSLVLMSALAAQTSRVKVWTTFHTMLQNPAVAAKMIATLDQVSHGRAGLNVVPGSYKGEFEQMGAWPEGMGHDERYDLATEWLRAVKALWSEPSVTMKGKYFHLDDCESYPKPIQKPRPFIVAAGMSERGMRFSVEETDAIFIGGRDDAEMRAVSLKAKSMAKAAGRRLRTYAMQILIIEETDEAAQALVDHIRQGFDEQAFYGMMRSYGMIDAEIGKENAMTSRARSGFMAPFTAGSPATVCEQISAKIDNADLDGLMLIFPDYESGLRKLSQSVLPALRARFSG